ncbi:unnamed protein product [Blepharisma stoltei]|uniref:Saposin B-type domain-containing protein n=1 Tax=Blepharisma stoltei TaxID=1481888 RepID=A0AAU9IMN5_9CILI|nr:unnamed protein product [Blepharisma stoltei]
MKFLLLILLVAVLAKKEKYPDSKAKSKPRYLSGELYCNVCQGITRELLKKLRHRSNEADVIAAMEDICNMWTYTAYDFPPPEFKKGCGAFVGYHAEELERILTHRTMNDADLERYFCHEYTKACEDIFWEHVPGDGINSAAAPTHKEPEKPKSPPPPPASTKPPKKPKTEPQSGSETTAEKSEKNEAQSEKNSEPEKVEDNQNSQKIEEAKKEDL